VVSVAGPKRKALPLPGQVRKLTEVSASEIRKYIKKKERAQEINRGKIRGRNFVHTPESKARFEKELAEQNEKIMKQFLRPGGFTGKVPKTKAIEDVNLPALKDGAS